MNELRPNFIITARVSGGAVRFRTVGESANIALLL